MYVPVLAGVCIALAARHFGQRIDGYDQLRRPLAMLGAGGALTGYAGGLARKQALLRLEGAPPSIFPSQPLPAFA